MSSKSYKNRTYIFLVSFTSEKVMLYFLNTFSTLVDNKKLYKLRNNTVSDKCTQAEEFLNLNKGDI